MVGEVRARSSECPSLTGEMRKYIVDVITEKPAATARLRAERFSSSKSSVPTARPIPIIGPISGEISMAPIITAVELVFRPSEAMNMAKIRISMFGPRKVIPSRMDCSVSFWDSMYPLSEK